MTIEPVRAAYHREPFPPFTIHLADGRRIFIPSGEFMLMVPSGRTIAVSQADDTVNIIDLLLVTDLEFKTARNGSGQRRQT